MITAERHKKQAARNLCFLEEVESNDATNQYVEWKITVLFYAALHGLQETFVNDSSGMLKKLDKHFKIDHVLCTITKYKPLRGAYQSLYSLCHDARYECTPMTNTDYVDAKKFYDEFKKRLNKIA